MKMIIFAAPTVGKSWAARSLRVFDTDSIIKREFSGTSFIANVLDTRFGSCAMVDQIWSEALMCDEDIIVTNLIPPDWVIEKGHKVVSSFILTEEVLWSRYVNRCLMKGKTIIDRDRFIDVFLTRPLASKTILDSSVVFNIYEKQFFDLILIQLRQVSDNRFGKPRMLVGE